MPISNISDEQLETPLILVAEPEENMRLLLLQSLAQEGYRVAEAKDVQATLEAYQRLHPDLVLLDTVLPLMDGFDCCQQLQRFPDGDRTPVLMVTAQEDAEWVNRAFEVGATDYVVKPIHWAVLRQRVRRLLQTKQAMEALTQQMHRERLMGMMQERIRQSLHLEEILNTTVTEVRQFLACDRVFIFHFDANWSGVVVVESVAEGWIPLLESKIHDPCFGEEYVNLYQKGRIRAVEDIDTANLSPCHLNLLIRCQVKANLVVPILQEELLWGLLIAHHCSAPRRWQGSDIELLKRLATQVAIAVQQAQLYQQLRAANRELQRLASLDGLTQVANRRSFDESLEREWRRLAREQEPLSLILLDIDYFKLYNDTYGHQAGDTCLQQVAHAALHALKRPADLLARYGGEEFAVILPNTPGDGAAYIAEQIRSAIKALAIPHGSSAISPWVTLSLGIASTLPTPHALPKTLIAAADKALYQAKAAGRDRICYDKGDNASGTPVPNPLF